MAAIRELPSGTPRLLEPEHSVGRGPLSALRVTEGYVSAQHAILRYSDGGWELKDLGSRNGTYLNGARIPPGKEQRLRTGARIAFGKLERQWELVDDSAPQAMAVPLEGGEPVLVENGLLALPSADDPRVTIYRGADGGWVLEHSKDDTLPLTNLQTLHIDGRPWRFCCVEDVATTALSNSRIEVRQLRLSFSVSRDEEFVELVCEWGDRRYALGTRAHNYLLLTLARRRLAAVAEGAPAAAAGWFDQEELARALDVALPQLHNDVFRIRKQFANIGVVNAASIIERRPGTQQLRIGTSGLSVVTI